MKQAEKTVLWVNCRIATCAGQGLGLIDNGAIAIQGGRIKWIGATAELPASILRATTTTYDGRHRLVTPGLIDCHTHLIYSGSRANEFAQRMAGRNYQEIAKAGGGIMSTVRTTRAASEQNLLNSALSRLKQMIAEGVTTVEIKSGYGLNRETELKMLRVARRLDGILPVSVHTTFLGAHSVPPEYQDRRSAYVDFICQEMIPQVAQEKLATAVDVFMEEIAFSSEETEKIFQAALRSNLAVKIHADQLSNGGGATLAARYGALSADHIEYCDEEAVKAMAMAGTVGVLLPGAFYFLKENKPPPVALMRRHGVPMAIGTDSNPGTSPTCSLQLMMNMACMFFGLTTNEALLGVTKHAAAALGQSASLGTLETGKIADMVVWDNDKPEELPYRFGDNPVHMVVKAGDMVTGASKENFAYQ